MLTKEAVEIVPTTTPGFYFSVFVTPKSSGGLRPIINLRPLNQMVLTTRFKMGTPKTV